MSDRISSLDEPDRRQGPEHEKSTEASPPPFTGHATSHRPGPHPTPLDRLDLQRDLLRKAYRKFVQASEGEGTLSGVAEWLLDNFYVIQQALRQIRENLPGGYYRRLPKLDEGDLQGYPRIYALARTIIAEAQGHVDVDEIRDFIETYQEETTLTMGEVWALPTMLRLCVVELLSQTVAHASDLEMATVDGLLPALSPPDDLPEEAVVANCIRSLRAIGAQDWKDFFEALSQVDLILREDPAEVYARMDFDTRDHYRDAVETLARSFTADELTVAKEALRLAEEAGQTEEGSPRTTHVGYYLLGRGRDRLEEVFDYRPPLTVTLRRLILSHPTPFYLGLIGLLTLIVVLALVWFARGAGGNLLQIVGAALLGLIPASIVAVTLTNLLVTRTLPPDILPKMDFSESIPETYPTVVVIPALLTSPDEIDFLLHQLELHYQGNRDPHLRFALLTDFADAPEEEMPEDEDLLRYAIKGIRDLNRRYDPEGRGLFYLFHRRRQWNPSEGSWMGWERKRGKLVEFNHLLRGDEHTSYTTQVGEVKALLGAEIRFVITLDADTILPRGAAHRLVATLAHPLNRAEFARGSGQVLSGYTILQPRTEIKPADVGRSLFSQAFAGDVGLDLYTRAVSDVYQDLFGEGIYVGKGIYDVDAFERSLRDRVPENSLLSHDLFEGIHGRAALVTDIVLYESYPPEYLVYAQRLHRWVRGDWQLLPWLLPGVPKEGGGTCPNRLSVIDRWKIFDNLRRSLHAPALLAFLVLGWLWLPGSPLVWTLIALFVSGLPLFAGAVTALARGLQPSGRTPLPSLRAEALRWLFSLVFLPYEALLMVDAIGATLVRLLISRKRLLQWTTSAHTLRIFGQESKLVILWKRMGAASVLSAALIGLIAWLRSRALLSALPLLLAWIASPEIALFISRSRPRRKVEPLSRMQRRDMRYLARRTWLFFERFVGPEDHWLPPDHFQEHPRGLVAHRTSPTNIGLLLLSTLGAHDLGYIGPLELVVRLRSTFETLEGLERYRGHFFNWYDTRSLEVLKPRYVSTVDSGNLAATLLTLKQGLIDVEQIRALSRQRWQGLRDTLGILGEVVNDVHAEALSEEVSALNEHLFQIRGQMLEVQEDFEQRLILLSDLSQELGPHLVQHLQELIEAGTHVLDARLLHDLRLWSERVHHHLRNMQRELDLLLPWMALLREAPDNFTEADPESDVGRVWHELRDLLTTAPDLAEISAISRRAASEVMELRDITDTGPSLLAEWCEDLLKALESGRMSAGTLLIGLRGLAEQAEEMARSMEFGFLFDRQREVYYLGYRVETEELDGNHYDLLASEARTTSLISIANDEIPESHWLHLSRPLTRVNDRRALLSWNGSMFEYLMPELWTRTYEDTLLGQTCRAVVECQMEYARSEGVPWGVSESGYYRFDAAMNYQYRGFGVPGLGRKRGLAEDLVITPYASLLALSITPQEVANNVHHLIEVGMRGHYGFYEAVDYTQSRLPLGQERALVRSYMAHHQGMIMVALVNYLRDQVMVERFHDDARIQSVELLLQEQVPQQVPVEETPEEEVGVLREEERVTLEPWSVPMDAPFPQVHQLSNGNYGLFITEAGGGYSVFTPGESREDKRVALTRWRADTTLDTWGTWIYLRDRESGVLWSAGIQPCYGSSAGAEVHYYPYKAEFHREDQDIALRMEITVAPGDNVEIRRLHLTNHSARVRHLQLFSYAEVVLAPQSTDRQHPAFNKMFIESEYLPEENALLFRRRPRSAEDPPLSMAHLLTAPPEVEITGAHEADRARFLGRGQLPGAPAALIDGEGELSGTTGTTLDPIAVVGQDLVLQPHASVEIAYVTLAADSRQEALSLARRYRQWPQIGRSFEAARSQSEVELSNLGMDVEEVARIQRLLSVLVYPYAALRADPGTLAANRKGQSGLWPYAISGDYPILLVRLRRQEDMPLVRELLRAHAYWRNRQIKIDLVILNDKDVGYAQELNDQLQQLINRMDSSAWLNRRGGIFVLRAEQLDEDAVVLLETAARAILDGEAGSLEDQLEQLGLRPTRLPRFAPTHTDRGDVAPIPEIQRPADLRFDNGYGGFSADGREYVIYLEPGEQTPAPWINVIANPEFGFLVSEAGTGYTWAGNSGENRLTPWRNDPVIDPPSEAIYLRDEETGEIWSPTPLPVGDGGPYLVRHGAGYTTFEHHSKGLKQNLRLFAAHDAPVKIIQLRLENVWDHPRRITATFYAEWVLATYRDEAQQYVVPEYDAENSALLARNPYNSEFGERVAFATANRNLHGLTADRTEFLGRRGRLFHPRALDRIGLSGTVKPGLDPCAAIQVHLDIPPGETREVSFLLGQGADRQEALALISRFQNPDEVAAAWEETTGFWDEFLNTVTVDTPDPAMDLMLNRWLPYQALSCRLWGRSAFYQSSGAFGFRDQLQDVMSMLHAAPELAREHILRSARHQFEAGDVLHWWHPPSGRGVRTRITDDLLWLPYVTAEYVEATGDTAILREEAPFRKGEPLGSDEEERYGHYALTEETYTIYEHCRRALEHGTTSGPHGLPLMGAGDWNDGMNRVGIEGRGESVWLGWFLHAALTRFAPLCEEMGDTEQAETYRQQADTLAEALEASAWDGSWYLRAYFDDGTPLGSTQNEECQIDSLPQSWAVLSEAGDPERVEEAMNSVDERLVRPDEQLLLLFTPPFDKTPKNPGYIKGYPPGVRENGGQYTHAALWAVWAFTRLGRGDRAGELFRLLNPVLHSDTAEKARRYQVEPYVVAADVYSAEQYPGHGGWTWYTGSSGWMYRLGMEAILGLHLEGGALRVDPVIPGDWSGYEMSYRHGGSVYHIHVENPEGRQQGVKAVMLDGEPVDGGAVPLNDDGQEHQVRVVLGDSDEAAV